MDSGAEEAEDLFFGRMHSPLHVIAARAGEQDRTAAARMLETDNDVESGFNEGAPGARDGLRPGPALLSTTAEALRSIGVTPSQCEI